MKSDIVLFLGKPGSGKGTQASLLSEKTGWRIISSGGMFREMALEDSVVGRKTKDVIDQGLLMPPWFAIYLFQRAVFTAEEGHGLIFEGSGRKVSEAEMIVEVMKWLGREFRVVHIKVSDEDIIARLNKRREIEGRADDNVIEKRLEEYRIYTEASIEVFRSAGVLIELDGSPAPDVIHQEILKELA